MEEYIHVLKNYSNFKGRATRKEYWLFTLIHCVIFAILSALGAFGDLSFISSLYLLATIIPSIAVCIRRLHDIDKSGKWFFISLIPLIGSIWLLILCCTDSDTDNQYGESPKYE